jgi:DNA-directed RNA polymerase specialized sigma24 family protein
VSQDLSQTEREIGQHLAASELTEVAVLTLRAYGSEVLGYLMSQLHSEQYAQEVFSTFAEDLWRSLPGLSLQTSMRAYAYALARNAKHRFLQRDLRKQRAASPLSQVEHLSRVIAEVRTVTAPHLALLTLRIDRGLEWLEIAEVFGETGDLKRAAAQKRKRFQLIKEKLAVWAREAGLLDDA